MTATLLRLFMLLWKPIAAVLAGLAIYGKGRADASAKRDLRTAREYQSTMERATDAPVHTDLSAAADRMRKRDPRKP